jgi:hypothetical protein
VRKKIIYELNWIFFPNITGNLFNFFFLIFCFPAFDIHAHTAWQSLRPEKASRTSARFSYTYSYIREKCTTHTRTHISYNLWSPCGCKNLLLKYFISRNGIGQKSRQACYPVTVAWVMIARTPHRCQPPPRYTENNTPIFSACHGPCRGGSCLLQVSSSPHVRARVYMKISVTCIFAVFDLERFTHARVSHGRNARRTPPRAEPHWTQITERGGQC